MNDITINSTSRDSSSRSETAYKIIKQFMENHNIKTTQGIFGSTVSISRGFLGTGKTRMHCGIQGWGQTQEFWVNLYDDELMPLVKELASEIKSQTGMGAKINLC